MSDDTFKLDIASIIDREKGIVELCTSDARGLISREVMRLKEQAVREGLIALGWSPPGVSEDLAFALKGIAEGKDAPDIDIGGESQFGLHCGVEDRGCCDRYDGADYGYSQGVERALEWSSSEASAALATYEARKAGPIMQALKNAHDALVMVADADGDCHRDGLPTIPAPAKATINAAINELESILPTP